jgi:cytochrome c-type biogenesis protein CcmF
MNQYDSQREPVGTPAVRTSLREDLYLSVMNIDPAQGTLGLLALVNPMVGWIWIATAIMALGGVIALLPTRATAPAAARAASASAVVPEGSR